MSFALPYRYHMAKVCLHPRAQEALILIPTSKELKQYSQMRSMCVISNDLKLQFKKSICMKQEKSIHWFKPYTDISPNPCVQKASCCTNTLDILIFLKEAHLTFWTTKKLKSSGLCLYPRKCVVKVASKTFFMWDSIMLQYSCFNYLGATSYKLIDR